MRLKVNDYHSSACGGHLSSYTTTQKILRAGYFWPSIFKDCILVVRKCHECQIYQRKLRAPPTLLHPVITIGPFAKWGIDLWHVILIQPRGMVILSLSWTTSQNGPKWCLHIPLTVKRRRNFSSIMWFPGLECLEPLSLTMAPILVIIWWLS